MIRALALVAVVALLGAFASQDTARRCRLPGQPLASHRDTAAWCAREFLIRNGYTQDPPSADRNEIALEPAMDVGLGFNNVLSNRRNTVSPVPLLTCTTATGFVVSFRMPNQIDQSYGRGVAMTPTFVGITLLRPWVRLTPSASPKCSEPRLP